MGRLIYDSRFEVDLDDRVLAHLQIVISMKLARSQGFYFSWRDERALGSGRTSLWLHPAIPLRFRFTGSTTPRIDPEWVRRLLADSHSPSGLRITPEPDHPVED